MISAWGFMNMLDPSKWQHKKGHITPNVNDNLSLNNLKTVGILNDL
jgi:hypothetical protein